MSHIQSLVLQSNIPVSKQDVPIPSIRVKRSRSPSMAVVMPEKSRPKKNSAVFTPCYEVAEALLGKYFSSPQQTKKFIQLIHENYDLFPKKLSSSAISHMTEKFAHYYYQTPSHPLTKKGIEKLIQLHKKTKECSLC